MVRHLIRVWPRQWIQFDASQTDEDTCAVRSDFQFSVLCFVEVVGSAFLEEVGLGADSNHASSSVLVSPTESDADFVIGKWAPIVDSFEAGDIILVQVED